MRNGYENIKHKNVNSIMKDNHQNAKRIHCGRKGYFLYGFSLDILIMVYVRRDSFDLEISMERSLLL